jgi:hypothetical protein
MKTAKYILAAIAGVVCTQCETHASQRMFEFMFGAAFGSAGRRAAPAGGTADNGPETTHDPTRPTEAAIAVGLPEHVEVLADDIRELRSDAAKLCSLRNHICGMKHARAAKAAKENQDSCKTPESFMRSNRGGDSAERNKLTKKIGRYRLEIEKKIKRAAQLTAYLAAAEDGEARLGPIQASMRRSNILAAAALLCLTIDVREQDRTAVLIKIIGEIVKGIGWENPHLIIPRCVLARCPLTVVDQRGIILVK